MTVADSSTTGALMSLSSRRVAISASAVVLVASTAYHLFHQLSYYSRKNKCKEHDDDGAQNIFSPAPDTRNTNNEDVSPQSQLFHPIGVVRSVYRLCVGTPRQGLLAPAARGRIELLLENSSQAADAVDGLQEYSHVWVVFIFHLNTKKKKASRQAPTKIAPPALGGNKVGVLATRSPHRFNPIGLTLAKLDGIGIMKKQDAATEKKQSTVCLYLSGLDLVDETPVLDIKPFVPTYDAPPLSLLTTRVSQEDTNKEESNDVQQQQSRISVPSWVATGLQTRRTVTLTQGARQDLREILENDACALEHYGPRSGFYQESMEQGMQNMLECIQQVLVIDVRSSYQTKKLRQGQSQAQRAQRLSQGITAARANVSIHDEDEETVCTQQLDNLLISFVVQAAEEPSHAYAQGSGAQDVVTVTHIQLLISLPTQAADPQMRSSYLL